MDVFLNVFEMGCELNKVGNADIVWYLAPLLSGTNTLDIFTLMDRESYKVYELCRAALMPKFKLTLETDRFWRVQKKGDMICAEVSTLIRGYIRK